MDEDILQINLLDDDIPVDGDAVGIETQDNDELSSSKNEGGGTVIKPPFPTN